MLNAYIPIIIMVGLAAVTVLVFPVISALLGTRKPSDQKLASYECGCTEIDAPRRRTTIQYYIIAILFVLFDIEAAFLYPWAVVFKKLPLFFFVEMVVFIVILLAGYAYLWKKGALEWE